MSAFGKSNPRPDLPMMLVVSNHRKAMEMQRRLDPAEFRVVGLGQTVMGIRVRGIIVSIGEWEAKMRNSFSKAEYESTQDWLRTLHNRLAADCQDQYFEAY